MIAAETRDRFANPEYHITFYFLENIDALLKVEEKGRLSLRKEKEKAGKTAF